MVEGDDFEYYTCIWRIIIGKFEALSTSCGGHRENSSASASNGLKRTAFYCIIMPCTLETVSINSFGAITATSEAQ